MPRQTGLHLQEGLKALRLSRSPCHLTPWSPPQPNGSNVIYYSLLLLGSSLWTFTECRRHVRFWARCFIYIISLNYNHPSTEVLVRSFYNRKWGQHITWPKVTLLPWSRKEFKLYIPALSVGTKTWISVYLIVIIC